MTATQLKPSRKSRGWSEIPAQGWASLTPTLHNAVMHMEDEAFGENIIVAEVFQAGFKLGEKVIRHALVMWPTSRAQPVMYLSKDAYRFDPNPIANLFCNKE